MEKENEVKGTSDFKNRLLDIMLIAAFPGMGVGVGVGAEVAKKSVEVFNLLKEKTNYSDSDIEKITEEIMKNESYVNMELVQQQAKIIQELAIASRIETAKEVEIEEFYDVSGGAGIGVGVSNVGLNCELGGKGARVTKRVYRFKGIDDKKEDRLVDKMDEIF